MSSDSLTIALPQVSTLAAGLPVPAAESRAELRAKVKALRQAHRKCLGGSRKTLEHARDAGLLALEIKGDLAHGKWLRFAKTTFRGQPSLRAIQGYIRIAEGWDELTAKTKLVSFLGIQEALRLLAKSARPGAESNAAAVEEKGLNLSLLAGEVLEAESVSGQAGGSIPPATDNDSKPILPGRLLLQPPRGGALRDWIAGLRAAYPARIKEALVLLPPRTDTQAFLAIAELASCLAFLKVSLPRGPNTRGIVAYLGDRVATFAEVFDEHAVLLFPKP